MTAIKSREDRLRRRLAKLGLRLAKTPARSSLREFYGPGYMVVDDTNTARLGASQRAYEASLEEVEEFASSH
ncbi:hypothetical protein [Nitrobacter sp.]|uniref:hypothetical protein n=1 Tax=Nitrobacter sp. TaxID=29420 RepID=UPI0029CABE2A|nr:hypothetical protein [Nitrobacter sp.]